ncbi:hypothetical protein [Pseudomonas aeruginosa]
MTPRISLAGALAALCLLLLAPWPALAADPTSISAITVTTLMAMGMMMLSPLIISLPFKIMLFVLVDGWALIIGTLAGSFGTV